ncbi:MAG: hypothetical protein LC745_00825, partial [Planctomycetia bacterium]|nr:hypothetical protein [Planctomycetia bacterium]
MLISRLPILFSLTLFLAAGLLFAVEPMVARMALPELGGSPEVWTTCVLFFQTALLAGYGFVYATDGLGFGRQSALQIVVLLGAFWFLPLAPPHGGGVADVSHGLGPTWGLLGWLAGSPGLPFFAVATTAPRLQRWFSATGHRSARDPYFLYAASNAGSLAALAAYPLWVERRLRLSEQSAAWTWGLGLLTGLVAACAGLTLFRNHASELVRDGGDGEGVASTGWLTWGVLALIPSSLMLGVTTYLTTDLAAIPLLWVIPLALYLLSFVVAFGAGSGAMVRVAGRLLPVLVMAQAPVMAAGLVQPFWIPLHLFTFFAAAVVCHGELARRRPGASRLTAFYLATAAGGALGGAFNAVVAPQVFDRLAEYPLAVVASCLVLAYRRDVPTSGRFVRRDLVLPTVIGLLAAGCCANPGGMADGVVGAFATTAASGLTALAAFDHRRRPARFALAVGA